MKHFGIAALVALILLPTACKKDDGPEIPSEYDNVVIFYTDGYNNLTSSIRENAKTICNGALPMKSNPNALIWVTHNAVSYSDYNTPVCPVIIQITSDWSGEAVLDTLKQYAPTDRLIDKDIMKDAFSFVRENFKSKHYGAVFSSHGTGWLPQDYYSKPTIPRLGSLMLKTFGASYEGTSGNLKESHEILVSDMAEAIPMHLDYIIFDACLMGGVEVAYELKDVTDIIGFSQAEILSTGFDYSTFAKRLLIENNPLGWCEDYYAFYRDGRGPSKSATISVVRCDGLEALAGTCSDLFQKYRQDIDSVNPKTIQGFFTSDKHWFYDLEDIFVKAGIGAEDHMSLKKALDGCIIFEAHTENMLGKFDVKTSCGLTSFLPSNGSAKLKNYYKTLSWNKATGFVK